MKDVREVVEAVLALVFGKYVPDGVQNFVSVLVAVTGVVLLFYAIVIGFGKAAKVVREDIRPVFYNELERRRAKRRRQFASHIEAEMRRIDKADEWHDYKYAELEAEVANPSRRRGLWPWRRSLQARRERSLSAVLRTSREKLVLLQGEPGSGKSVALHHLTSTMARTASKARSASAVIPLYVDLKSIDREAGQRIDAALIDSHVMKTLSRLNDPAVKAFLEDEFRKGMEEGTWLFLFDSFDEIPDILSETSVDSTIREYGNAIADYLAGFNRCRGIVASRYFRSPDTLDWPRFEIVPLTDRGRRNLIKSADLPHDVERALIGEVELARTDLAEMSGNPLFLALLCEYMRGGHSFPENAHAVFENYVTTRLERDEQKLRIQFDVATGDVRHAAEVAAFCMAAATGLGLSPSRAALVAAMKSHGFEQDVGVMLDAMAYIKLARAEEHDRAQTFTFTHRRFQEYFATCVVMKRPDAVSPDTLLTDARWRETAVVLLQTQNASALLEAAGARLGEVLAHIRAAFVPEVELPEGVESVKALPRFAVQFPWPPLALHLLALLQSGFRGRRDDVPESIREAAGRILLPVAWCGSLMDRRWAIEVAGAAPQPVVTLLLHDAYASGSTWLGEAAYRQAGTLRSIDEEIARPIRHALVKLFLDGRLFRQKHATRAHLMRLPDSASFVNVLRLLLAVVPVDVTVYVALLSIALAWKADRADVTLAALTFVLSYPLARLAAWSPKAVVAVILYFRVLSVLALTRNMPALAVVALPASIWSTLAVLAAAAGQCTRPVWWPFLPLFPFVYAFRNGRRLVVERFDRTEIKVSGLAVVVVGIAAILAKAFDVVEKVLLAVLALAFCGGAVLYLVQDLYPAIRDAVHFYRSRRRRMRWTGADVVQALAQFRGDMAATAFIRFLRQQSAVEPSQDSEQQVRAYAIHVEQRLNSQYTRAAGKVVLLDELNILAEHLRAQRSAQ